jgi:hypothetical protein
MWIRKIYKNIFFISLLICAGFPAIANDVQKAQRLLTELGFNPGPIDGAFGNKTELALINFYVIQMVESTMVIWTIMKSLI